MTSSQLAENLKFIEQKVLDACVKADRSRSSVKILLATKTVPSETVLKAYQLGYKLVGENKVQEMRTKQDEISNTPLEWHFIGHLQSNKVKDVLGRCRLIHSLDRLSLAQEIDRRAMSLDEPVDVLIEVNTSREQTKSGLPASQTIGFCKALGSFKNLRVKGLMTMAMPSDNEDQVRQCFRDLKMLFDEIKALNLPHFDMQELSMGMSQDFTMAIEEGATLIRLGSAVFGSR
jgi:PLP dependent protein